MLTRAPIAVLLVAVLVLCAASLTMAAALELGDTSISDLPLREEVATNIWFQGFIADSGTGEPVTATYDIMAEIYNAAGSGDLVWGPESHLATSIVDGWFNIELGHYVAMIQFGSPPYYLELTINGEVLAPRLRLGSAPSAIISQKAVEEDGDWGISGGNVFRTTGNVGIGLSGPSVPLEVRASEYVAIRGASTGDVGTFYGVMGEGTGDGSVYGVIGNGQGTGSVYGIAGFADGVGAHGRNNGTGVRGSLGTEFYGVHGDAAGQPGAWAGYFDGRVHVVDTLGVGTETPEAELDVNGTAKMLGFHMPDCAVVGRVLTCDGSGVGTWQDAPSGGESLWLPNSSDIYLNAPGRVGIGTQNPDARLDVVARPYETTAMEVTNSNVGEIAHGIDVEITGDECRGLYSNTHSTSGTTWSVYAETSSNGGTVHGVFSDARCDTGTAYGAKLTASSGQTMSDHAYGVHATANYPSTGSYGVHGTGGTWGVMGKHNTTDATGALGGGLAGVYGDDGIGGADWAGYFVGDVYVDDALGVGIEAPLKPIHVYTDYSGAVTYGIKLENFSGVAGSATGILFKVDDSHEDRGKGGIVYERTSTWNRGSFHILQDSGENPNVANLADAVFTVENSGDVGIGTTSPASKLEVAGIVHSTSGGFKFPDGSIQTTASLTPPAPERAAGNVVLNETGEAMVELPASLSAEELLYQLTCIGGYAPVYVAEKVRGGMFRIAGGEPGMEVSWQVTGE